MEPKALAAMMENIEQTCARQKTGEHRFFQLLPGKPEKLVEVALFTHVWKKEEGGWKLTRVVSYDHRLTN